LRHRTPILLAMAKADTDPGRGGPRRRCPGCGKPAQVATRPFCSRRCADVDLGRWLGGVYRVPGRDGEAEEPAATDRDGEGV